MDRIVPSSERWASPADTQVPFRRATCGHREMLRDASEMQRICPVCKSMSNFMRLPPIRDFGPRSDLTWPWANCTLSKNFVDNLQGNRAVTTVERLAVLLSPPASTYIHLATGERIKHLKTTEQPSAREFHVWRTFTSGSRVRFGIVDLPERGILLLTGHGVHFHKTIFKGGIVMCAGANFSGTFRNCSFHGTTLHAVHGASITLHSCHIRDAPVGLVASGGATLATFHSCDLFSCRRSVSAHVGAAVIMHDCRIHHTDTGVIATGRGTAAALHDTHLHGGLTHAFGACAVAGTVAAISLHNCRIHNFSKAFSSYLCRCNVEVHGTVVTKVGSAFLLPDSQRLMLRECHVRVKDLGNRQDMEPDAVAVGSGGMREHMPGPEAAGRAYACAVVEKCSIVAEPGRSMNTGVAASGRTAVAVRSSDINCTGMSPTQTCCVAIASRSRGHVYYCRASSANMGVSVTGSQSRLHVRGGVANGETAVIASDSGALFTAADAEFHSRCDGRDYVFDQHGDGGEVVAVQHDAHAWFVRSVVHGGAAGVYTLNAHATLKDCDVRDVNHPPDLRARRLAAGMRVPPAAGVRVFGGRIVITGGSIRSCEEGIFAPTTHFPYPVSVKASSTLISDCLQGARFGAARFTAELSGCKFQGRDSSLESTAPDAHCAIRLIEGGKATIRGCLFQHHASAIMAACSGGVEVSDCQFWPCVCPKRGYGTAAYVTVHDKAQATLRDCQFTGSADCGLDLVAVAVKSGSKVRLLGENSIQGFHTGLLVHLGSSMSIEGLSMHACKIGANNDGEIKACMRSRLALESCRPLKGRGSLV